MNNSKHNGAFDKYPESAKKSQLPESSPINVVISAVLKRPWMAILAFLIILIPSLFYLNSLVPKYSSNATISIPKQGRYSSGQLGDINSRLFSSGDNLELYFSLVKSGTFKWFVRQNILSENPHFTKDTIRSLWEGISMRKSSDQSRILTLTTVSYSPEFSLIMCNSLLKTLEEKIIDMKRKDSKFLVEYVDKLLLDLNIKLSQSEADSRKFLDDRGLTLNDVSDGVDSELRSLQSQMTQAQTNRDLAKLTIDTYTNQIDNKLKQFLSGNLSDSRAESDVFHGELKELNKQIIEALENSSDPLVIKKLQIERKEILSNILAQSENSKVKSESNNISLKTLEREIESAILLHRNAQTKYEYFQLAFRNFKKNHPNLSQDILEYVNLVRSKEVQMRTIDILLEKRETARIGMMSEVGGLLIVDYPVMGKKLALGRVQKLMLVLFLSMVAGLGITHLFDHFDNTVQNESDITAKLNLPVLGSIPVLGGKGRKASNYSYGNGKEDHEKINYEISESNNANEINEKSDEDSMIADGKYEVSNLLSQHRETSPIAEAYRSVKTSILFLSQDLKQKFFVISSSVASEGKSITTHNIGVSFAQGEKRTLIIDADLRRASQHKLVDVDRYPGLTGILLGETTFEKAVVRLPQENLYLLPAGINVNNPAELLSSNSMKNFLDLVEDQFDIILIDTPPISPCMDSRYLAKFVGGIILIVRNEVTKIPILEHCVDLCNRLNVEVLGVVLNHTKFRYGYGYYYVYQRYNPYGYYNLGYEYYYSSEIETGDRSKKKRKKQTKRHRSSRREKSV